MDLLEEHESHLALLRRAVDEADADFREGRFAVYSDDALPQLAKQLKAEARLLKRAPGK